MTFVPVIPTGGLLGFQFLERTSPVQKAAHDASPRLQRDLAYFQENIGAINTAEELVSDFRLLRVALGAFGLEDDIGSKFFIQKVLEDGTLDTDALSNRLTDKRYKELAGAFGFDLGTPNTKLSSFAGDIIEKFKTRSFEASVGEINEDMRLALNAKRELAELGGATSSEATKWFTILGNAPLRSVFEGAFSLPSSFGSLDIDRQVDVMQERSEALFGSAEISRFTDDNEIDAVVERFLVMRSLSANTAAISSSNTALVLLGAG